MSAEDEACDARNWRRLRHLSSAPEDPTMARDGIARYRAMLHRPQRE